MHHGENKFWRYLIILEFLFQENHQELADRTGYHIVERRKERDYFPVVVASPSDGKVKDKEVSNELEDIEMDYERLYYGGKTELKRPPKKPFYFKTDGFRNKFARVHKVRNQHHLNILKLSGLVPRYFDQSHPQKKQDVAEEA